MKDIQQLIKKNSQDGRYEDIFPKTFIQAVNKAFDSVQLNSEPNLITTIMAKQVKKEKPKTGGGTGSPT